MLTRVSKRYSFEKPNDRRALDLMNAAAAGVMREIPEVILAYGMSDEYRYAVASLYLNIIAFAN
jgi:tRNA(His) guanylyltransferase